LPGELYWRENRWWWRVKLPGEDKTKARPLGQETGETSAGAREVAEKITFEMWEDAVRENVLQQAKLESAEKIERLKAQFLDKVRHFTELMETTNAKLEAQEKARTEAEAKLAQMIQAAARKPWDGEQRVQGAGPATPQSDTQAGAAESDSAPIALPASLLPTVTSELQSEQPPNTAVILPAAGATPPVETGICECCGAMGIAVTCLTRIDSGQSLCPRCLAALRTDVARMDRNSSD
jgi:hypothetical protein